MTNFIYNALAGMYPQLPPDRVLVMAHVLIWMLVSLVVGLVVLSFLYVNILNMLSSDINDEQGIDNLPPTFGRGGPGE